MEQLETDTEKILHELCAKLDIVITNRSAWKTNLGKIISIELEEQDLLADQIDITNINCFG